MPLNSIPSTTSAAALETKVAAARARCHVDVGFWGGLVPGNAGELEGLAAAGVLGFKCFLVPSGVPEFGHVSDADLESAAPTIARLGVPLLVHAEDEAAIAVGGAAAAGRDPRAHATWLASRPAAAELTACRRIGQLAARWPLHVHVVHVASREAVTGTADFRSRGARITLETCPHYLSFAAEEIPAGATEFKCAPPIREGARREALWEALRAGEIILIATDHSPCPPAMKLREQGDFMAAWGGIASLELSLAAVWTGARDRGFTPADLAGWMSAAPARLAGLGASKGAIARGHDADLVAFDPAVEWTVDPSRLHQRHPITPYAGRRLAGRVLRTWLRGELVWDGERVHGPRGRLVRRGVEPSAPVS
jgi:allantoinase